MNPVLRRREARAPRARSRTRNGSRPSGEGVGPADARKPGEAAVGCVERRLDPAT
ncbi:MAG: hypothetical protein MZV70_07985 [Desulfobacterales bacterium]|nr:hypothetical protein [Desulfobacterales bacterium]